MKSGPCLGCLTLTEAEDEPSDLAKRQTALIPFKHPSQMVVAFLMAAALSKLLVKVQSAEFLPPRVATNHPLIPGQSPFRKQLPPSAASSSLFRDTRSAIPSLEIDVALPRLSTLEPRQRRDPPLLSSLGGDMI